MKRRRLLRTAAARRQVPKWLRQVPKGLRPVPKGLRRDFDEGPQPVPMRRAAR